MTDSALSLLGLALRGNNLAVGDQPVAEACKNRRACLVAFASDAAQNSVDRAERLADAAGAPWVRLPWDKAVLGGALGRTACAVAALTDRGLAGALAAKLAEQDESLRPLAERLAAGKTGGGTARPAKKKKSRARKKPAVPET